MTLLFLFLIVAFILGISRSRQVERWRNERLMRKLDENLARDFLMAFKQPKQRRYK